VFGFDGAFFNSFASHHGLELGVGGVACHGLAFASNYVAAYLAFCEAFVVLADGLNHCHGQCGPHVEVGKATAYAIWFPVEGDVFALGGSDDPFASGVVTDCETIVVQLGEGYKIGNAVADKPKVEKVLVPSFLGGKICSGIAVCTEGYARRVEVVEVLLGEYLMEARCAVQVEAVEDQCFAGGNNGGVAGLVL
jgi:hypothetical protein